MSLVSMENVQADRVMKAFTALGIASFGSLWKVTESIWKETIDGPYDLDNTRHDHPGCSLRKHNTTLGMVPMLHGTSNRTRDAQRRRECIAVKDVYGAPHTTYFGGLDPVFLDFGMWQGKGKGVESASKSCLDDEEIKKMKALCVKKGW